MKNKNFSRIITIEGDIENIYGYDVKNKELYIKSKSKMTGMGMLPIFVISGVFPSSAMNFAEHHSITISPAKWLILTTVVCVHLSFILASILLFLSENFSNYRNFEKLEDSKPGLDVVAGFAFGFILNTGFDFLYDKLRRKR